MPGIVINVRKSDIRHIRISCRCGRQTIAEIPQQVAAAMNLHVCGCGAGYGIQQQASGQWEIKRMVDSVSDMAVMDAEQAAEKKDWKM
jgi:hypothetical protein